MATVMLGDSEAQSVVFWSGRGPHGYCSLALWSLNGLDTREDDDLAGAGGSTCCMSRLFFVFLYFSTLLSGLAPRKAHGRPSAAHQSLVVCVRVHVRVRVRRRWCRVGHAEQARGCTTRLCLRLARVARAVPAG